MRLLLFALVLVLSIAIVPQACAGCAACGAALYAAGKGMQNRSLQGSRKERLPAPPAAQAPTLPPPAGQSGNPRLDAYK